MMKSFYFLVLLFLSVSAESISCDVISKEECSLAFVYYEGETEGSPKYGCRWENGNCVDANSDYCENISPCTLPCLKVNNKCTHLVDVESCSDLNGFLCESLYSKWPSKGLKCVNVESTCSDLLVNCSSLTNKGECLEYPHNLSCVWTDLSKETGSNCIDILSVTSCSVIEAAGRDSCSILRRTCYYLDQSQKCVSMDSLTSCSDLEGCTDDEYDCSDSCANFRSFPNVVTLYGCISNEEGVCSDATETMCGEENACNNYNHVCISNGDQCVSVSSINSCDELLGENICRYLTNYLLDSPNFEENNGCFWDDTQRTCQSKSGICSDYDNNNCDTYPYDLCLWNGDKCASRESITTCEQLESSSVCENVGDLVCVWKEESCQELDCGELDENSCKDNSNCLFDGNDCKSWSTSSIQRCNQIDYDYGCTSAYRINLFCDWKDNSDSTGGYCYNENIEFSCDFLLSDESCWSFEGCFYLDGSCVNQEDLYVSCSNLNSTLCTNETIRKYLEPTSSLYGCKMFNNKCVINYAECSQITESEQCSLSKSKLGIPTDTNVACTWVVEENKSECKEYTDECRASTTEEDCTSNKCFWNSNTCVSKEWITNCAQILASSSCTDDGNTFENLTDGPCLWDATLALCHSKRCSDLTTSIICGGNSSCLWLVSDNTNNGICKVKQSLEGPQEILSKDQCTSQFINENFVGTTNIIYVWNSESDTVTTESGKQPCKKKSDLYSCILIEKKSLCVDDDDVQCSWKENKCISKSEEPEPDSDSTSIPRLSAFVVVVLVSIAFLFMLI